MGRAVSLPKLSLRPCLAMAIITFLLLLTPNSTLAAVTGSLKLTDASWQDKTIYRTGETLYIQVTDTDENEDSTVKDSLSVSVASNTEATAETVTLTETGISTGVFQGSIDLDDKGGVVADGKLQVTFGGDKITVTYKDLTDDWSNTITIVKTADFLGKAIGGNISTDTTWTKANSPYIVSDDVFVKPGVLLSIEPGVEVMFMSGSGLFIAGTLRAMGTPSKLIRFASYAESPTPGDWGGIIVQGEAEMGQNGKATLQYCIITEGKYGIGSSGNGYGGMNPSATISNSMLSNNVVGISFGNYPGGNFSLYVINSIISQNEGTGIGFGGSNCSLENNNISDNKGTGINLIYQIHTGTITIKNNYISGNKGDGVTGNIGSTKIANIENNRIIGNHEYGIYCFGATIKNNHIMGNNGGVVGDDLIVENNYIFSNFAFGVNTGGSWGSSTIKNNYISGNKGYGVNTYKSGPLIAYNSIIANNAWGIYHDWGSSSTVNYNNLHSNGSYDFYNKSSADNVNAKYNYWGSKTTQELNSGGNPKDISTIWYYFDGGSDNGMVNYSNWLNNITLLPPTAVMFTPGDNAIDLSWAGSEGAAGYYLYYGLSSGTYYAPIDVGNNTSYQLTGLSNNTTYYIALTAYDGPRNESAYSYEIMVTTGKVTIGPFPGNNKPNTPSNPSPPDGALNQSINTILTWHGGDPDADDTVTYDIYFAPDSSRPSLVKSGHGTNSYNPGILDYSTTYYWQIVAKDKYGATDVGPIWVFMTGSASNNPPNTPSYPSPADGSTNQSINTTLTWQGGDPDTEDTVTYDIYFGTSSTPSLVASDLTTTSYNPGTLAYSTTYYWQIVAKDNHGATTTSSIWKFTTAATLSNNPPNTPSSPNPSDGATNQPIDLTLSWSGGDPDAGDSVSYNLYFGTSSSPPLVKSNLSEASYSPGTLAYGTKYYWRVVAKDNHGAEAGGPVWIFETSPAPNNPPYTPSSPSPANGATVASISLRLSWNGGDPDTGDSVAYDVYWDGAGNNPDPPLWASNQRDTTVDVIPIRNPSTVYYWKIVAKDNHGATSTSPIWKFTTAEVLTNPPNTPTGLKATVAGKAVHIQWQANSESNLDHYNLYLGNTSKGYNLSGSPFNVGNVTSLTASDVPEGTYYLALSAVNSAGLESSLSEEIKVVVGAEPTITISSNASSYSPGDTFSLSFGLSNPTTTTQIVDVFMGIIAPDGSLYFFDSTPFLPNLIPAKVDDPRTFVPASTSLQLSPGYDFPLTPFFSVTLPTGLPEGTYQAFAALAEPGSVQAGSPKIMGDVSISSFTYSP